MADHRRVLTQSAWLLVYMNVPNASETDKIYWIEVFSLKPHFK